jgi:hypothetical protein
LREWRRVSRERMAERILPSRNAGHEDVFLKWRGTDGPGPAGGV